MDEAIQVTGRLLDCLSHFVIAVEIEDIGNEIERILIVLNFRVQSRQVEAVCKIVLVDFAEVLISARRYELFES